MPLNPTIHPSILSSRLNSVHRLGVPITCPTANRRLFFWLGTMTQLCWVAAFPAKSWVPQARHHWRCKPRRRPVRQARPVFQPVPTTRHTAGSVAWSWSGPAWWRHTGRSDGPGLGRGRYRWLGLWCGVELPRRRSRHVWNERRRLRGPRGRRSWSEETDVRRRRRTLWRPTTQPSWTNIIIITIIITSSSNSSSSETRSERSLCSLNPLTPTVAIRVLL